MQEQNNQNTNSNIQQQTQQQQLQQDSDTQIKESSIEASNKSFLNNSFQQQTQELNNSNIQNHSQNQTTRAQYAIQQINKMFSTLFDYLKKLTNVFRRKENQPINTQEKKEAFSLVKECKSILTKLRDIFSKIFTKNKSIDDAQQTQLDNESQQQTQLNTTSQQQDAYEGHNMLENISHISQSNNNNLNQESINNQYPPKYIIELANLLSTEMDSINDSISHNKPEKNNIINTLLLRNNSIEPKIQDIANIIKCNRDIAIQSIKDDLNQGKKSVVEKMLDVADTQQRK